MNTKALSAAAALFLSTGLAQAGSVLASADAYVQRDNSGPHGLETWLGVKYAGTGYATRKTLIRFDVPPGKVSSATLSLDVITADNGSGGSTVSTIQVWGIAHGSAASCGESFNESAVRYNDLSLLADSSLGVVADSPCLHDGDPGLDGAQMLGTFQISAADMGKTVNFSSVALSDLLNQSADGTVTVLLTRAENGGTLNTSFASRENTALQGPRLSWIPMEELTPTADTYVKRDNSGGHGSEPTLVVTNYDDHSTTREALLRFDVPAGDFTEASLSLTLSNHTAGSATSTYYLFGIKDGTSGCGEGFNESTLLYSHLDYLDESPDNVVNSSSCLHSAGALATLSVTADDVGQVVTFSSPELVQFLQTNQDGKVAFILTKNEDLDVYTAFASKESTTYDPPKLSLTRSNEVAFVDGTPTLQGNGQYHYDGTLQLPFGGPKAILLPNASVNMTLDSHGRIQSIEGTVGLPSLPGLSTLGPLGAIEASTPSLSIGYGTIGNVGGADLPYNPDAKYFYLSASTATGLSWGPMSVSAPGAADLFLAIDPMTPAVWTFASQDGTFFPVGTEMGFGFSGAGNITFEPTTNWHVEPYMTPFDGDVYVHGAITPPLDIEGVDVTLSDAVTIEVNDDVFSTGQPGHWIQSLGTNANVSASISMGPFSIDYDAADASLLYRRDTSSVTFSATVDPGLPGLFHRLPFQPASGGTAKLAGHISNSASDSYVDFEGTWKFGTLFQKQTIEGSVHLTPNGGSFQGKAKFAATTVNVAGEIDDQHAAFSGSIKRNFGVKVSGVGVTVKTVIKAAFDTNPAPGDAVLSLSAKAKVCGKVPGVLRGCASAGIDEVSVTSDKKIKICVKVPRAGVKCDTLD